MIPLSRQSISKQDLKSVNKALKSDFLARGPTIEKFEKALSKKVNCKFSVAVNSATSALHIACLALGFKKNDILWTVPNSFVASANCAIFCGGKVDFVDIDENTFNISIQHLEKKLRKAKKINKIPKIIVTVHLGGNPSDLNSLKKLSRKYKFKIIEDASHALGAKFKKNKIGSCKWSDISVFSFHPSKIITTFEGGAATTNNLNYFDKLKLFRSHGITKDYKKFKSRNKVKGRWYYEQLNLGYNYWMNDVQAALGLSQLKRLDKIIKKRNILAKRYDSLISNIDVKKQEINSNCLSTFHLYIIRLLKKSNIKNYNKIF